MPVGLILFWLGIGLGTGSVVLTGDSAVWHSVDHRAKTKHTKPTPDVFRIQSNYSYDALALTKRGNDMVCPVTVTVTASRKVRLVFDDAEQNIDTGWTFDYDLKEGKRYIARATFIDPMTGKVLSKQTTSVSCWPTDIVPDHDQILYDERGLRGYEPPYNCPCCTKDEQ